MKNVSKSNSSAKIYRGGVKWYREKIVEMVESIKDEKFLIQIHTILKKHIEKRGD